MNVTHIAITTRYCPATGARGASILATTGHEDRPQRLRVPYNSRIDADANHAAACEALAVELGWAGTWWGAGIKSGYAFVQLPACLTPHTPAH